MRSVNANILLITNTHEHPWSQAVKKALSSLGTVETETEDHVLRRAFQARYDLIIVDARYVEDMPMLLSRLQTGQPNARVVVTSASLTWKRAREAFLSGALDYIPRSINAAELRSTFENILAVAWPPDNGVNFTEEQTMAKATILFADNDRDFLETRKEYLEKAGFQVLATDNLEQAKQILEESHPDLAILDIRMVDNEDERDLSGLILAQEAGRFVPKILLTDYPAWQHVRDSMRSATPVANYLSKEEGEEVMLREVERQLNRRVFIVHGRDDATKAIVANFISKLGLTAIILHEQPGAGRTIIEKFENYSNVGFAVVLLTPDDVGGLTDRSRELKPRARQNVIFELGYFVGKLGRRKVSVLYKEGVEIPSDYQGVEFLLMGDDDGWKLSLAKNMKYAGLDIDLNRAI